MPPRNPPIPLAVRRQLMEPQPVGSCVLTMWSGAIVSDPKKVYDHRIQEWVWPDELDLPTPAEIDAAIRERPTKEPTHDQ